ncbi:hypothetical protein EXIGLDRAFT_747705 [Exidia glandulosa HHB12029]|uniref:Uncharacterized protein n=1 Tax=Exidia glandulosa HHB12029 TaxID=1314781 RepID=A0A165KHU7_EXIGL|nr:hypothetical protein EXIGLDRAFT_747705 [Exidia glandulosa HHB12029]
MRRGPLIEQQRKHNEEHNSRLLICSTPSEILSEILDWAVHADDDLRATTMPDTVSAVCRRWRNVAIASPCLWSRIAFSSAYAEGPFHWEGDALYLERSRAAPLDVCIEWDRRTRDEKEGRIVPNPDLDDDMDDDDDDPPHWLTPADVNRAARLLLPHVSRFRSFSIECEVYFPFHLMLSTLSPAPANKLQWLELSCTRAFAEAWRFLPAQFGDAPPLFAGHMPALRDATFTGVHVAWDISQLVNLRSLSLAHHALEVRPTMGTFRSIVESSPSLAKLELIGSCMQGEEDDDDAPAIPLVSLEALALRWMAPETLHTLVTLFPMRNLRRLAIADCMGRSSSALLSFIGGTFVELTELELERVFGVQESEIVEMLAKLPRLQKLVVDHAGSARLVLAATIIRDCKRPALPGGPIMPALRELHILNESDAEVVNVRQYLKHRAAMKLSPLTRCSVVQPDIEGDGEDERVLMSGDGEIVARVPFDPSDVLWHTQWDALANAAAMSEPASPPAQYSDDSEADEYDSVVDSDNASTVSSGFQTDVDDEPSQKEVEAMLPSFHEELLAAFT